MPSMPGNSRGTSPAIHLAFAVVPLLTMLAPATGQCSPYSKRGMQRLRWNAGDTLTVGSIQSERSAIAFTFGHDANLGITMQKIGHRGTRADGKATRFEYSTVPPTGTPAGLWKAILRPVDSQTPSELGPGDASRFSVWVDSHCNTQRAIFSWFGCCIPNHAAKSLFWFEMDVRVSRYRPARGSFTVRMARYQNPNGSVPFTIDEVHAPIVHAAQPGDSQLARILVPSTTNVPLPSQNLSMRTWQLFNLSASLQHPARGQQMQFSALYGGDTSAVPDGDEVISPHRKILYFSTEDRRGHFKFFNHDVVSSPTSASYRWCPVHYPTYGPTPNLNVYVSPYETVVCALQAKSSAYWYDVAQHYRSFVRWRLGLTPIRSRYYRGNPDVVRESVLVATSTLPVIHNDLEDIFEDFVDMGRHHQAVFTNPGTGKASPFFMEWQKWLKANPGDAEDPIGPGLNPTPFSPLASAPQQPTDATLSQIARAHALGMNVSVYTVPLLINNSDWPSFDSSWILRDRMGAPVIEDNTPVVDHGARGVAEWFAQRLYDDVLNSAPGLGGFFFDTVGGRGSFLRYPAPGGGLFNMKYHGGTKYVDGTKRLFDTVRARIAAGKSTNQHPDIPFIPTEAVQEFYTGRYDAAQHGLKPLPLQAQLSTFIDQLTAPGSTPPPIGATTCNPPLWNAVYHEYSRAEALGMMLSTRPVSSLLGGGQPFNPATGKVGVTWEEWGDYMRMVHATMFMQGMKPMLFSYFYDFRDFSLLVENGSTVGVRNPGVPQQGQLLGFMQRLHAAVSRPREAGQFLNFGMMERPLELPAFSLAGYDPQVLSTKTNPAVPMQQRTDALPGVNQHFYEDPFTQFPYPVANVMHSVWRTSPYSRNLGLVFVNWTDEPANWTGTFDPSAYGCFRGKFDVIGVRPNGGSVSYYKVGSGNGTTTFRWGGGGLELQHHSAASPGMMPPRSVQVFWIVPTR